MDIFPEIASELALHQHRRLLREARHAGRASVAHPDRQPAVSRVAGLKIRLGTALVRAGERLQTGSALPRPLATRPTIAGR